VPAQPPVEGGTLEPTALLVVASPRSGTTLLGGLLDLHPDIVFVGEVNRRAVWLRRDAPCGCGEPMSTCPFWAALGPATLVNGEADADHGSPPDAAAAFADLGRVQAAALAPRAVARAWLGHPTADQRRYVAYLEHFYRQVAVRGHAAVVVDTSKENVAATFLLSQLGEVPIQVLHLRRDPRGVVTSRLLGAREWLTRGQPRRRRLIEMGWPIVGRDSAQWDWAAVSALVLARRLRRRGLPVRTLDYDQLVEQSRPVVESLVRDLGLDPAQLVDAWETPDRVSFPDNHSMGGNRVRFRRGATELAPDVRWRTELSRSQRWVVEVVTWPARLLLAWSDRR
jgi:hypothetical protein